MTSKRDKDRRFVAAVAKALADYGIKYDPSADISSYSYGIQKDIRKVLDSNWKSIWQTTKDMVKGEF